MVTTRLWRVVYSSRNISYRHNLEIYDLLLDVPLFKGKTDSHLVVETERKAPTTRWWSMLRSSRDPQRGRWGK